MDARDIRSWCMQHPRPASVRLTCGKDQKILTVDTGATWAQIGRSIASLEPDMLEALDANGSVLRATRTDDELDEDDELEPEPEQRAASVAGEDAETRRYRIFVDAIREAYAHANGTAFDKLVAITDAVGRRSDSLEARLALTEAALVRAHQVNAEIIAENAGEAPDPATAFVTAMVQGQMQKAAADAKATNGHAKPNGKG